MLPEYGRHIHQMVDYLCTIEDRTVRNEQAHVVVEVMGNINPVLRDAADFKHKLWDHLFIMSRRRLALSDARPANAASQTRQNRIPQQADRP